MKSLWCMPNRRNLLGSTLFAMIAMFASTSLVTAHAFARVAQDPQPDFAKQVLPILETKCFACHQAPETDARGRTKKPKGGLRLDGADWIRKGGDTGRVVIAGQPSKSELLRRIELPADDADLMPPKDGPLSDAEILTLRTWITAGAEFGTWTGAAGPASAGGEAHGSAAKQKTPAVSAREIALRELAEGLSPLSQSSLSKLASERLRIEPLTLGAALLRVSYPAHRSEVSDADVTALGALEEHIAILDLSRSQISSKSVARLARMPRLVKLDLADTKLSAKDLVALAPALRHVRELNLNGTRIDDSALTALASLPVLEDLYLWRTAVTEEGAAKLRQAKPELNLRHVLELPDPPAPNEGPPNRRRR